MNISNRLSAIFNPEEYHGWSKRRNFFEGWYFKIVSTDQSRSFAIIPGISMSKSGEKHAFIQILDSKTTSSTYYSFNADVFLPKEKTFYLEIENNIFSEHRLKLALPALTCDLKFEGNIKWSNPWYSPNIMGPFTFLPFMQCNHGILSMNHTIYGTLSFKNETINFNGGKGYLEKDWGNSFPEAYTWLQCNHFPNSSVSLKASVAKIPYLGTKFTGFIAGLLLDGKIYEFTTYNLTQLKKLKVSEKYVLLVLSNTKHTLNIKVERGETATLISPINGSMSGTIEESMNAQITVKLLHKKTGKVLFESTGTRASLEVAGDIRKIEK